MQDPTAKSIKNVLLLKAYMNFAKNLRTKIEKENRKAQKPYKRDGLVIQRLRNLINIMF